MVITMELNINTYEIVKKITEDNLSRFRGAIQKSPSSY